MAVSMFECHQTSNWSLFLFDVDLWCQEDVDLWVHQWNPYVWFDERCWHLIILGALSWQVFKLNSPIFWGGIWKRTGGAMGLVLPIWEVRKRWWSQLLFVSRRSVANMPDEGNIEHSTEKYQYFSAKWIYLRWRYGRVDTGIQMGVADIFFWKTLIDTYLNDFWLHWVDGRNPAHQLRLVVAVVYPIYQGFFVPSLVVSLISEASAVLTSPETEELWTKEVASGGGYITIS